MAGDNAKLDLILSKLESMETKFDGFLTRFDALSTRVDTLESSITSNTANISTNAASIAAIQSELASNKAEIRTLKTSFNNREQRLRSTTLRIFNVPATVGESLENFKPLASKVYDKILRPALVAAKSAGDIPSVPQQATLIEACFRTSTNTSPPLVPVGASASPTINAPPIVVRLSSNTFRWAIMKHRRSVPLPPEGDREAGIRRYAVVEDLTPDSHRLLKQLQRDDRTEKVWSSNGQLFFTRPNTQGYQKVKNIFDSIDTILA